MIFTQAECNSEPEKLYNRPASEFENQGRAITQPLCLLCTRSTGLRKVLLEEACKTMAYRKYSKEDQRSLAAWATDCAERVLPLFEKANPTDDRPRKAIETCRAWVGTGVFKMTVIRGASLASHAAARETKENDAACFAARAAGQAVATAHVAQHAYGSAYYALKAIAAEDPANAEANIAKELDWQSCKLPEGLRQEIMSRITIQKNGRKISIKVDKSEGF